MFATLDAAETIQRGGNHKSVAVPVNDCAGQNSWCCDRLCPLRCACCCSGGQV